MSVKELCETIEAEYSLDDAGIERFTPPFNKFMIVDSKPINEQIYEFHDYIHHLQSKGNQFSDEYKAHVSLINSLLPNQTLLDAFITRKGI